MKTGAVAPDVGKLKPGKLLKDERVGGNEVKEAAEDETKEVAVDELKEAEGKDQSSVTTDDKV